MAWSDEVKAQTRQICTQKSFEFGNPVGLCFKHVDDKYGLVSFENALADRWLVVDRETKQEIEFATIDDLISGGWVLD
jgi:hypothetical protein